MNVYEESMSFPQTRDEKEITSEGKAPSPHIHIYEAAGCMGFVGIPCQATVLLLTQCHTYFYKHVCVYKCVYTQTRPDTHVPITFG